MAERLLAKEEVASSTLVFRSSEKEARQSAGFSFVPSSPPYPQVARAVSAHVRRLIVSPVVCEGFAYLLTPLAKQYTFPLPDKPRS